MSIHDDIHAISAGLDASHAGPLVTRVEAVIERLHAICLLTEQCGCEEVCQPALDDVKDALDAIHKWLHRA